MVQISLKHVEHIDLDVVNGSMKVKKKNNDSLID